MRLRTRLFLPFAGLAAALVLAQWFWVRSLARGLEEEVGLVAVRVGENVAAVLQQIEGSEAPGHPPLLRDLHRVDSLDELPPELRVLIERSPPPGGQQGGGGGEPSEEPSVRIVRERESRFSWVFDIDDEVEGEDGADAGPGRHLVLHLRSRGDVDGAWTSWTSDGEGGIGAEALRWIAERELGATVGTEGSPLLSEDRDSRRVIRTLPIVERIPLPEGGIRDRLEDFASRSLIGATLLLGVAVLLVALIAHRISAPLGRLAAAARDVGSGALGRQVDAGRETGEVGEAIAAFNQMSRRLEELDARTRALEQERQLAEIGDIARGLAHALRNPLNALGLAVEALTGESGRSPASARAAVRAREQIRRVDASVRSFLVLASEGAGEVVDADVGQLARDVALEAQQDAGERLRVRVDAPQPATLHLVEAEVRAILQALVVNAIEASPDGAVVEIRVRPCGPGDPADVASAPPPGGGETGVSAGPVAIEVLDRGPGLPPRVRERLFAPHVSTKPHGSGMGLFLAHRIAAGRYGGSLAIGDREGGGSVARLVLGVRDEGRGRDG